HTHTDRPSRAWDLCAGDYPASLNKYFFCVKALLDIPLWILLEFAHRHDQITNCEGISSKTQNPKLKSGTLPSGIVPGLDVLVFLLRFSDLIPSLGAAGSVISTTQSKYG